MVLVIGINKWLRHYQPCDTVTVENVTEGMDTPKITKLGNIHFQNIGMQAYAQALFNGYLNGEETGEDVMRFLEAPDGTKLLTCRKDGRPDEVLITDGEISFKEISWPEANGCERFDGCFVKMENGNFVPQETISDSEYEFDLAKEVYIKKNEKGGDSLNQETDSNCPMSPEAAAAIFLLYLAKNKVELEMGKQEIECEYKLEWKEGVCSATT